MAKPSTLENHIQEKKVAVVMVPLPAQGHLNQLLHLTRLIATYHLPLHFVGTTTHNRQARTRAQGFDPLSMSNIKFHEFETPSFETPPPNPNSSTKFPSQLMPSFYATRHLREPVTSFIRELSKNYKRVVVIYDSLIGSVLQDAPSITNVECYCFNSTSAFTMYSFIWEIIGKPVETEDEFLRHVPSIEGCFTPEVSDFARVQTEHSHIISSGELINSCYEIEGKYIDLLSKVNVNRKQWVVGPLNPVILPAEKEKDSTVKRHRSLEWLDEQSPSSVIFVSFGSTTSLSDKEIEELVTGLEESEQKFIWVLRDADKGDIFAGESRKVELPQGYEERIEGRGLIVRDWAPQLEILGHPSTGGFVSHCGWNSCMESISMGVPIATWPMHSEQPRNAVLVTQVLKTGIVLKDWAERDELVSSVAVKECVKKLMGTAEGDKIRERAKELGKYAKHAVLVGGSSRKDMDSFIAHITR